LFRATRLLNSLVTVKEIFRQYYNYAILMYLSKPKESKAVFSTIAFILNKDKLDKLGQK
jgi:hypothetical protein